MSLFGIIFGITMIILISKALIETAWGLVQIAVGIFCYILSWVIDGLAIMVRVLERLNRAANWGSIGH